ncbi:mini-chromosome maintenance complex-binding protein isoform X2 [Harpegnathos saltator]|uniref:mini-chromosome maintenance complex-binding protein isoform X2 n=1 Tax=Harpegnathos saltator TaxID=610380 RepID=UPI00058E5333|nr:mini-chromosome maintenance complex-binding protein isoform X2 [Harpegnathos saltator]XP_019699849.1 mini-chromosome maintenance complex-binding protein isoform X2 [Harpegnathos saltator]
MTATELRDWTSEYYITNESSCQQILKNSDILREIPLLNDVQLHNIKDKQLVRFQGMVQDMYDPEYYFKQYEVKNIRTGEGSIRCGMYTDIAYCLPHEEILFESNKNENSERQTYIIISTPGLNQWAKERNTCIEQSDMSTIHNNSIGKRSLIDQDDNDTEEMDCSEPTPKREKTLADTTDINISDDNDYSAKIQSIVSEDHILNFPIPIDGGKACIVKIYDGTSLKLNQVVDIVGFVSLDPMLSTIHASENEMNEAEINTHNPPASLVPRLHAVKIIELNRLEIANAPEIISKAQLIRGDLHIILSQLLFGDHLAADYLICHLLSTIYIRKDYFCLGTFPLNITNFPSSKLRTFPKELYNFLTLFVKKSHFLEITLENLNELALIPKKDYECNRLTSGILQLSNNTHLVLDETGLTAGELTVTGKENYKALSDLLIFQKLKYDFKYYTVDYETDIPMLIFSDVKSFVPCPMQVVLNVDAESENLYSQVLEAACQYLKEDDRLANIRQYLEVLRHMEFVFDEQITEAVQNYFVEMRSSNRNINTDDLHALIVFARLMSMSYGKTTLDTECWNRTVQLETERMSRLPQRG